MNGEQYTEKDVSNIKFSIMTPVYKVEEFLDQCVQSVLNQSYVNFELLLVDDGSPDNSGAICDRYAQQDNRVRVFHKKNEGLIATRRFALSKANGDYYVFLDSDDYLEENALQVIHDAVASYDADCVIYGYQRVLDGKTIVTICESGGTPIVVKDKRTLYRKCVFDSNYNSLWRKAVKSSLFTGEDYSSLYRIKLAEDLLQSLEIYNNSCCTVFIPDVLYNYRLNHESMTQTIQYKGYSPDFTVRQRVVANLQTLDIFTAQDFFEYRSYCIKLLIIEIERIARFDTCFENKKALFEQISEDPYYVNFLNQGEYNKSLVGSRWFLFPLFQKKQYKTIIALEAVLSNISKLRHR